MTEKRCPQQLTWDDFPPIKDERGWYCRRCKLLLAGRRRSWCSRQCEKEVLLMVEWRYIRACIRRRDKYLCQMPREDGTLCLRRARHVDHIEELADGGSFHEWSNLRALCEECHKVKTNKMRAVRAARRRAEKKIKSLEAKKAQLLVKPVLPQ